MIEVGKYYTITNTKAAGFKVISKCISNPSDMHGYEFLNVAVLSTDLTYNGEVWNAHKTYKPFKISFNSDEMFSRNWRYKEIDINKHPEYFL